MSLQIYNAIESHTRNQNTWLFDAVIWWLCLPLAFKVCPQTLAHRPFLDSPTQVQARTLTSCLCFILSPLPLSGSSHTSVQSNGYFSTHWQEEEKTSHVEFIKQFECDYVNERCLIHATAWTSGVHTDCDDKLLSLAAVHVCSGCLWLLNHLIVWECLHLYSSHTPLKVIECF